MRDNVAPGEDSQPRPHLAERRTLRHDDLELPLAGSFLQEGLNGARVANGHDHLIGVDVLQCLHSNVISGALCNRKKPWLEKQPGKATLVLLGLSSNKIIFY